MKVNCLLVDDEPLAIKMLKGYCEAIPELFVVGECSDAFEATEILKMNKVDMIYLDINMPKLSGIDF